MLEANAKDQGHRRKCSQKTQFFFKRSQKKKGLQKNFASASVREQGLLLYVQAYASDLAVLITGADML